MMVTEMNSPNGENRAYGEHSALSALLGEGARVLIIAALLSEDHRDMEVKRIAELAGVHRTTVYDHLEDLEDLDVVVNTRSVAGSPLYQINQDSPIAQGLKTLEMDLLDVVKKQD